MVDLRVISLGAGVQSSALYLMALDGILLPRPDVAIFADTHQEPYWVYENIWRLANEGGRSIPIRIATTGDLGDAVRMKFGISAGGRFASVPFWSHSEQRPGMAAPGRRQCTREYKIDAVTQDIRRMLGVGKGVRCRYRVDQWIGISADEVVRAKPSRVPWITTRHPFLFDLHMRRDQIEAWLLRRGWPTIKKSACVFCPYRSDTEWLRWRSDEPDLFEAACAWDESIRDGRGNGPRSAHYISRSLVPLRQLTAPAARDSPQGDLFGNECEGVCGV